MTVEDDTRKLVIETYSSFTATDVKMKIFLLLWFTFALTGLRKAQTTEDDLNLGKFDALTDGSAGDFSEESFTTTDTDNDYPSDSGGILRRGAIKRPRRVTRQLMSNTVSGSCVCGQINRSEKEMMVKGKEVHPPNKYPWTVAIQQYAQTFCGGALISEQYILTAAHCVARDVGEAFFLTYPLQNKFFRPSELKIAFVTDFQAVVTGPPIEEIIPHPDFDFVTIDHDIAVVKLKRKIICSKFRRPICLPREDIPVNLGKVFTTVGWGTEGNGSKVGTKNLMEAQIKMVAFSECRQQLENEMKKNFYCLKGVESSSPCHGDSGGPMFAEHRGKYYIFGLTSMHTSELCNPDNAFIYTKVPRYMDWINSVIKQPSMLIGFRSPGSRRHPQRSNWQFDGRGPCRENEVRSECGAACQETCGNRFPECTKECAQGCFCMRGYIREKAGGKCIPRRKCSKGEPVFLRPCRENEVRSECGAACQETCANRFPECTKECKQGCFCMRGYIREKKGGKCIPLRKCSKGEPVFLTLSRRVKRKCKKNCPPRIYYHFRG